jgi:hypothetical protein
MTGLRAVLVLTVCVGVRALMCSRGALAAMCCAAGRGMTASMVAAVATGSQLGRVTIACRRATGVSTGSRVGAGATS